MKLYGNEHIPMVELFAMVPFMILFYFTQYQMITFGMNNIFLIQRNMSRNSLNSKILTVENINQPISLDQE